MPIAPMPPRTSRSSSTVRTRSACSARSRAAASSAEVMTYQMGPNYDRWRQLGKPKFEDIKLQVGMAMSEPFYTWISKFFDGKVDRKTGAIVAADFYYKERARRNVQGGDDQGAHVPQARRHRQERRVHDRRRSRSRTSCSRRATASSSPCPPASTSRSCGPPRTSSFRLDGFEACNRVTKIDSFTIKQTIIEHHMGGRHGADQDARARSSSRTSRSTCPRRTRSRSSTAQSDAADRSTARSRGGCTARSRPTTTIAGRCSRSSSSVPTSSRVTPDKSDVVIEEIKRSKVELYTEKMAFTYHPISD